MDIKINDITKIHPCFANEAYGRFGRVHLPVSPICNLQCRFCKRSFNKTENRPGVTSEILSPENALKILEDALNLCPEITVVGIAGPGDPLATCHALMTFRLIDKEYPDLIKCLSTNGLKLYDRAENIINLGVKTVTVTINAVDPIILSKMCSYILANNKLLSGIEAAKYLIDYQIKGVRRIAESGIIVKINTVLVPGLNDNHIEDIAMTMTDSGATMMNIRVH